MRKSYRKKGIGKPFYEKRLNFAKEKGYHKICFYTIVRDEKNPRKPPHYKPLDPMWKKMGFHKHPEITGSITDPELGQDKQTPQKMVFWTRSI